MAETILSGSVRKDNSSSKQLKFCINFKPSLVDQLDLTVNRYVEITHNEDNEYTLTFKKLPTVRSRLIRYNKGKNNAALFVDQPAFKLQEVEPVNAKPILATIRDNAITFKFNKVEFLTKAPSIDVINKIETPEDKIKAGFTPHAAWAQDVGYRGLASAKIEQQIWDSLRLKVAANDSN